MRVLILQSLCHSYNCNDLTQFLQLNHPTEAGQALREDTPDVRKVIDKEIVHKDGMIAATRHIVSSYFRHMAK